MWEVSVVKMELNVYLHINIECTQNNVYIVSLMFIGPCIILIVE